MLIVSIDAVYGNLKLGYTTFVDYESHSLKVLFVIHKKYLKLNYKALTSLSLSYIDLKQYGNFLFVQLTVDTVEQEVKIDIFLCI